MEAGSQWYASAVLQSALLLFIAKLGLLVGASLPKIFASGYALLLQELGHFFGTMVFGLPVALLLGIRREAVGATFSVGREPSLAIIGERYGMDSPEGRGVLAEYITGTVLGVMNYMRDRGRLRASSHFAPASEYGGPACVTVTIVNAGRRPLILRMWGGTDTSGNWVGTFLGKGDAGPRLGEYEMHKLTLERDDAIAFTPDDGAVAFEDLWIEDSLGRRHRIRDARATLKQLRES